MEHDELAARNVPIKFPNSTGDSRIERPKGEDATDFAAAARFIRASEDSDSDRSDTDYQRAEQAKIIAWVEAGNSRLISDEEVESWQLLSNKTSEHQVFLQFTGTRVLKVTWPGFYGQIPHFAHGKLGRVNALPSEYLERQALQNEVFASDFRLEGINISKKPSMIIGESSGQPSFVVSQRFIEAADLYNPIPSSNQIAAFLDESGFSPVAGSYFGWIRNADGVALVDAKPDNFIFTTEGVVPIDLQIARIPFEDLASPSIIMSPV